MNNKLRKLIQPFLPFIVFGISIAAFIGILFVLSYVLIWGLIIGGIFWIVTTLSKLFTKPKTKTTQTSQGRIIEHDSRT